MMQLEAIKAERGLRVEDGTIAPMKPLVEVLKEAKEAKEAKFQAVWKSMKVGIQLKPWILVACTNDANSRSVQRCQCMEQASLVAVSLCMLKIHVNVFAWAQERTDRLMRMR